MLGKSFPSAKSPEKKVLEIISCFFSSAGLCKTVCPKNAATSGRDIGDQRVALGGGTSHLVLPHILVTATELHKAVSRIWVPNSC